LSAESRNLREELLPLVYGELQRMGGAPGWRGGGPGTDVKLLLQRMKLELPPNRHPKSPPANCPAPRRCSEDLEYAPIDLQALAQFIHSNPPSRVRINCGGSGFEITSKPDEKINAEKVQIQL
jgi:hypothetical protein